MINKFKRSFALACVCLFMSASVSSCYVHNYQIGDGPQENHEIKKKNHFLIGGLIPLKRTDPHKFVGDKNNYHIKTKQNVLDVVLTFITAGIYAPTTTIITE